MKLLKTAVVIMGICGLITTTGCAMNTKETPKGSPKNYQAQDWFTDTKEIDFCHAIEWDDTNRMQKLLDGGLDINTLGQVEVSYLGKFETNRITFLNWAYIKQKKASYQYLLEHGADPNIMEQDVERWGGGDILVRFSVISLLAERPEDPFYLSLALKHSGNPNVRINDVPLIIIALRSKSLTNIQLLVEAGADINIKTSKYSFTPLESSLGERYDIAYYLLQKGANLNISPYFDLVHALNLPIYTSKGEEDRQKQVEYRKKVIEFLEKEGIDLSGVTNR
jgi:ankyrin repeat protein